MVRRIFRWSARYPRAIERISLFMVAWDEKRDFLCSRPADKRVSWHTITFVCMFACLSKWKEHTPVSKHTLQGQCHRGELLFKFTLNSEWWRNTVSESRVFTGHSSDLIFEIKDWIFRINSKSESLASGSVDTLQYLITYFTGNIYLYILFRGKKSFFQQLNDQFECFF